MSDPKTERTELPPLDVTDADRDAGFASSGRNRNDRLGHTGQVVGFGHIIGCRERQLLSEIALRQQAERERDEARKPELCDVCCGAGKALGDRPCICGGSGKSYDEKVGLRVECDRLSRLLAASPALPGLREALQADSESAK